MKIWIGGFVSGFGYSGAAEIKETDAAAMRAFVDKWCAENPLQDLNDAAAALVDALIVDK